MNKSLKRNLVNHEHQNDKTVNIEIQYRPKKNTTYIHS